MDLSKYSRQTLFRPIGPEGQLKLLGSRVVIVGCGALGSAHAAALARAGVGTLRIVDRDFVEPSNLQRQSLFDEADAAESLPKAVAAERKLNQINSDVRVEGVVADVTARNIEALVAGFDVALDGTDNYQTRYLLNDAALKLGVPWIYGAVVASYAATMTVVPGRTPCLACVFPEPPQGLYETCDTAGVISPAVHWASALQVAETFKLLLGQVERLHGMLAAFDVWENRYQAVRPVLDRECRACQKHEFVHLKRGANDLTTLCGRDAVQVHPGEARGLDLEALEARLARFGPVKNNRFLLRGRLERYELTIFTDGRAIIKGTDDPAVARGLYAKYIGL
jgi:adenylyltransferase/sulfurtransferase